jgi:hypothetical protein
VEVATAKEEIMADSIVITGIIASENLPWEG